MKTENVVGFSLLGLAVLAWVFVVSTNAKAATNHNNEVIKACLEESGYTPEKFYEFNFSKAAACHSDWRVAQDNRDKEKQRQFLAEHPWYKGTNWKWEEKAEYTCEKIYSTQLMNTITVCSKPIYLN
jgi:hypothetical protein